MNATNAQEFSKEWKSNLNSIIYGYILPVICVVGFAGNCINLVVLANWRRKVVMIRYLMWMSVSDVMVMVFSFSFCVEFGFRSTQGRGSVHGARYYYQTIYVLINTFMLTSISIVLVITIERFVAIWTPLKAKMFFTHRGSTPIVCGALLLALGFTILLPFQYTVEVKDEVRGNGTVGDARPFTLDYNRDVFGTQWFKVYTYTRTALYHIVCIILVFLLNTVSSLRYHRAVAERRTMSQRSTATGTAATAAAESDLNKQERYLRVMLGAAVAVYTVCLAPMAAKFFLDSEENFRTKWFQVYTAVANTLEVANSAVNFYLYCASSREFRKQCRKTFTSFRSRVSVRFADKPSYVNVRHELREENGGVGCGGDRADSGGGPAGSSTFTGSGDRDVGQPESSETVL